MAKFYPTGGGVGNGSDDVTANKAQVLEGYTAITHDSADEPGSGSMLNRNVVGKNGAVGINSNYPSVATTDGNNQQIGVGLDGKSRFNIRVPSGFYDGQNYVGVPTGDAASAGGLTAAKIGKGQTAFGLAGAYNGLGNAGVTDVRKGKTFSSAALSNATGTMIEKAAATYTPKTTNQTIAANQYLAGAQTIKGDANLVAANILKGKSIFGVAGSAGVITPYATRLFNGNMSFASSWSLPAGDVTGFVDLGVVSTTGGGWAILKILAGNNAVNSTEFNTWLTIGTGTERLIPITFNACNESSLFIGFLIFRRKTDGHLYVKGLRRQGATTQMVKITLIATTGVDMSCWDV